MRVADTWISSMAHSANAFNSASHDDIDMQCCRRETEPMPAPASMIVYPVVERVTAQLLSAKARSLVCVLGMLRVGNSQATGTR